MSKGSARRPGEGYEDGFDRIFGKKEWPDPPREPTIEELVQRSQKDTVHWPVGTDIRAVLGDKLDKMFVETLYAVNGRGEYGNPVYTTYPPNKPLKFKYPQPKEIDDKQNEAQN